MASEYYRVADLETRVESLLHSVALVVAAFVFGTLVFLSSASLLRAVGYEVETMASLPPLLYAALSATQFLGFFAVIGFYLRFHRGGDLFSVEVPSLRSVLWMVGGFVGLFVVAAVLSAVFRYVGVDTAVNQVTRQVEQYPVLAFYMLPVTFLFVAPAEELLYRGLVQGLFRRAYGVVPAVLLASLFFGAPHYFALLGPGDTKLPSIVLITVLGLVLGALYELSENLAVPIVVHACWNSFSFLSQYVEATAAL
ncbi:CPBP family intramembrane glutamic endopeptidase [Halosimplex amylolyticum]|uniref:CPBP family intramembrane glutamic endopeptidase n=1 Tax=Halosimplex amylolyticum TaxID=3396616 RepID=UPI003F566222